MSMNKQVLDQLSNQIEAVLDRHGVAGQVTGGLVTSRMVRFHLQTAVGTKVRKVSALNEEIAMALGCREVRIQRNGGKLDIEMARRSGAAVRLVSLLDDVGELPSYSAVLGVDTSGVPLLLRLVAADVTHVLIAGTTGSGKTAMARALLASLAARNGPDALRIILIDPKRRGFLPVAAFPNVLRGVISEQADVAAALEAVLQEMEERDRASRSRPVIVVAIDELADLIQTGGKAVEQAITRITQRGREAGIHVVACTQKPSAALIGGGMKANFPVRLVGAVASRDEARYAAGISDSGAERLEGRGDFLLIAKGESIRFQAAWVDSEDMASLAGDLTITDYEIVPA